MAGSNKTERNRVLKANRAAGIGDETGRIPVRTKDPGTMIACTVCKSELKCTKTNTEMKNHATSKHGEANYEVCFPAAEGYAKALLEAGKPVKGAVAGGKAGSGDGMTKAQRKKKAEAGLDDLLSAGISSGKSKGKKGNKK